MRVAASLRAAVFTLGALGPRGVLDASAMRAARGKERSTLSSKVQPQGQDARQAGLGPLALRAGAAAALCRAAAGVRRAQGLKVARAAEADDALADARYAVEAAKLELQAAKLRAECTSMERDAALERNRSRAGSLLSGSQSVDGEYRVSVQDLPTRLKDVEELDVTVEEAQRLASVCGVTDSFGYEQLSSESFAAVLDRFRASRAEARASAQAVERELAEAARKAATQQAASPSGGAATQAEPSYPVNDNSDQNTRILASLSYVLPLIDAVQFGLYLVQLLPFLAPLFAILAIPNLFINSIPYGIGNVIFFGAWILIGSNRELPRLLRFSMQQSVLLDIAVYLPNVTFALFNNGIAPPEFGAVSFLGLCIACAYCVFRNVQGQYPDNIPLISNFAKESVDGPSNFGGDEAEPPTR